MDKKMDWLIYQNLQVSYWTLLGTTAFTAVQCLTVYLKYRLMPDMSSPMDFRPSSMLKSCSEIFSPIMAKLANMLFTEGVCPTAFKVAQIKPLLKKDGLDGDKPGQCQT